MRVGLVEAIVRGDLVPWAAMGALWLFVALALLLQGRARPSALRVLALLALAGATSAAGLVAATALAVPRVRWRPADPGDLLGTAASTWRRLQGPAVLAIAENGLDIAVPTEDAEGRWILVGLLSGRPVEGLAPVPDAPRAGGAVDRASAARDRAPSPPADAGGARICRIDATSCRPWPAGWPSPDRVRPFSRLTWAREGALNAIAFDVESDQYLRGPTPGAGDPALELTGDLSAAAELSPGEPLFTLRRMARGRLTEVRVVARAPTPGGRTFALERADVSLSAPRAAFDAALPLLVLGALGLPLGALAYLVAPAWLAAALRRRGAARRVLPTPLVLDPIPHDAAAPPAARVRLATVRDDADLGDAMLPRGAVVPAAVPPGDGAPITAWTWYELPPAPGEGLEAGVPGADAAVLHEERGARRRVGLLVPADPAPFARTARGWLSRAAQPIAIALAGLAAAAPAAVALASLLAAR